MRSVLVQTLVELADTLVDDFDVVDTLSLLADRCVEVLDVQAAGVMLASPDGQLRVVASSSEAMRVLELFEIQAKEGPCLDCHRTGQPVVNANLDVDGVWPMFSAEAMAAGYRSAHALPLRLRGSVIGALNLFRADLGALTSADVEIGQAFADVATMTILQHRAVLEAQEVNQQLSHALSSRILLEQAKGIVAERRGIDMEQSFAALRSHARHHNLRLRDLADTIVDGWFSPSDLGALPSAQD